MSTRQAVTARARSQLGGARLTRTSLFFLFKKEKCCDSAHQEACRGPPGGPRAHATWVMLRARKRRPEAASEGILSPFAPDAILSVLGSDFGLRDLKIPTSDLKKENWPVIYGHGLVKGAMGQPNLLTNFHWRPPEEWRHSQDSAATTGQIVNRVGCFWLGTDEGLAGDECPAIGISIRRCGGRLRRFPVLTNGAFRGQNR